MKKFSIALVALLVLALGVSAQHDGGKDFVFEKEGNVFFKAKGHEGMGSKGMWFEGKGQRGGCEHCGGHGLRGKGMQGKAGFGHFMAMADKLELTDQQKDQFKEMRVAFAMERIDREADLKKSGIRLRMVMHDEDAGESAVMKAIDESSALKADMAKMKYRHHKEMKSILTEDQLKKMGEFRDSKGDRKGDRDGESFRMKRRGMGR